MADLRVKKQGEGGEPPGRGKLTVPLWPFLLLFLLLIPALLVYWPHPRQEATSYFNPVSGQNQVFTYEGRRFAPVPDAPRHQVAANPEQMLMVGRVDGQDVYSPIRTGSTGGGGGPTAPPPVGLYLRSGNDLFVPLKEVPSSSPATSK